MNLSFGKVSQITKSKSDFIFLEHKPVNIDIILVSCVSIQQLIQKALPMCNAFYTGRIIFTYLSVFGKDIEYYINPIIDDRQVSKWNWINEQEKN